MSYDISIWSVRRCLSRLEAEATWSELCENEIEEPAALIEFPPMKSFLAEVEEAFPPLSSYADEDIDSCLWSGDFDVGPAHVTLSCSYSRSKELVQFVLPLAHRYGLAVYDLVTGLLYAPPSMVTATDCTMESPWLLQKMNARPEMISDIVAVLAKRQDPYLVVARSDEYYMQTLWTDQGYILEFREGNAASHYRGSALFDADTVASIIRRFVLKEPWQTAVVFENVVV